MGRVNLPTQSEMEEMGLESSALLWAESLTLLALPWKYLVGWVLDVRKDLVHQVDCKMKKRWDISLQNGEDEWE